LEWKEEKNFELHLKLKFWNNTRLFFIFLLLLYGAPLRYLQKFFYPSPL
jgi:hypothetical protein